MNFSSSNSSTDVTTSNSTKNSCLKSSGLPISLQNSSYPFWDSVSHFPLKAMVWVLIVGWRWRASWELRYWWVECPALIYPTALQLCLFFIKLWVHHHHNQAINFYDGLTKEQVIKCMTSRLVTWVAMMYHTWAMKKNQWLEIFSSTAYKSVQCDIKLDIMEIAFVFYIVNIYNK